MFRAEKQFKVNVLSPRNFSRGWCYPVMSVFILKRNLLLILLLVDTPMEWDHNWRRVLDPNDSPVLTGWICVLKIDIFKWILFKIDLFAVNSNDVKVHHSTVTSKLIELRSLVITCKDKVFLKFTLVFRVERDVDIYSRALV